MGGVLASGLITILSVFLLKYHIPNQSSLLLHVGPCIYWLFFFAIGVYYSQKERNYSLFLPFILLMIGGITQMIEYQYIESLGKGGIGIKGTSWVYATGVIFVLISEKSEKLYKSNVYTKPIQQLGENSFCIFLMHSILLIPLRRYCGGFGWLATWVFTTLSCMAFITVSRKILPSKYYKYLGLKQ